LPKLSSVEKTLLEIKTITISLLYRSCEKAQNNKEAVSFMYSNEEINQLVYLVAEVSDPDRIILFGSYAYGNPDEKSDIDLLVIKNGKDFSYDDEAKLSTAVFFKRREQKIRTRYDVFFQTERQARKSAERGGAFVDALQKGRVVYERTHQ
jgi:predicted nucleotidyltransferase